MAAAAELGRTGKCSSFREPAGWMPAELPEHKEAGETAARHVRAVKAGDARGKRPSTAVPARPC